MGDRDISAMTAANRGKPNNRSKGTPFAHAIRKALKQYPTSNGQANALRRIADEVIECALDRDNDHFEFAVKEIGARIDGSPKRGEEGGISATEFLHSISDAFTALNDFKSRGEEVHGETIVQDRPVLSSEVRPEEGGYGEGVDIPEVSRDTSES